MSRFAWGVFSSFVETITISVEPATGCLCTSTLKLLRVKYLRNLYLGGVVNEIKKEFKADSCRYSLQV